MGGKLFYRIWCKKICNINLMPYKILTILAVVESLGDAFMFFFPLLLCWSTSVKMWTKGKTTVAHCDHHRNSLHCNRMILYSFLDWFYPYF